MSRDDACLAPRCGSLAPFTTEPCAATERPRTSDGLSKPLPAPGQPPSRRPQRAASRGNRASSSGRPGRSWLVGNVMTADIAIADGNVSCKQAIWLMTDCRLTAVPVMDDSLKILGTASEADGLRKEEHRPVRSPSARTRRPMPQSGS